MIERERVRDREWERKKKRDREKKWENESESTTADSSDCWKLNWKLKIPPFTLIIVRLKDREKCEKVEERDSMEWKERGI